MATPNTLLGADTGVHVSIDAPGTGEKVTQALFQRYLQPILDSIYSLSLHKADSEGAGATTAYVDDRVRQARNVKKTAGTYTVSITDEQIECYPVTGTLTLNLSSFTNNNHNIVTAVDAGLSAGTHDIILHPEAGKTINGVAGDKHLTTTGGSWTFWRLADDSGYWLTGPV